MGGGKSSSSSSTASETTTTTGSATGVVGDVFQGETIAIHQELPDAAVDVFSQLIDLAGQSIGLAGAAGEKAINTASEAAKTAAQPDVALLQGYQKQVYYAIGAVAVVAVVIFLGRKK